MTCSGKLGLVAGGKLGDTLESAWRGEKCLKVKKKSGESWGEMLRLNMKERSKERWREIERDDDVVILRFTQLRVSGDRKREREIERAIET